MDIPLENGNFTWTNRRKDFCNITEKLNRFLFYGDMMRFPFALDGSILPFSGLDHFPILLEIIGEQKACRCSFKFERM